MMRSTGTPMVLGIALATLLPATPSPAQEAGIPVVRFHVEAAAELLETAYPERYGPGTRALEEDLEWAREHAGRVTDRWSEWGPLYLQRLEDLARELGLSRVRLETNKSLQEAQALYRSSGYRQVKPFNDEPYAHFWFEKHLTRRRGVSR